MKCRWNGSGEYSINGCSGKKECELVTNLINDMNMFGFDFEGLINDSYMFKLNSKEDNMIISALLYGRTLNEIDSTVGFDRNSLEELDLIRNYHVLNTVNYFARVWLWNYPSSVKILLNYYTKAESKIRITSGVIDISIRFDYCGKKYLKGNCDFKNLFTLNLLMNIKNDDGSVVFDGIGGFSFSVNKSKSFDVRKIIDKFQEIIYDGLTLHLDNRFINTVKLLLSLIENGCEECSITFSNMTGEHNGKVLEINYGDDEVIITNLPENFLSVNTLVKVFGDRIKKRDFKDICH